MAEKGGRTAKRCRCYFAGSILGDKSWGERHYCGLPAGHGGRHRGRYDPELTWEIVAHAGRGEK